MLTILSPSFTHICIFTLLAILTHFSHVAGYERRKMTAVSEGGPEGGAQGPRLSQLTETREAAGSNSETSLILQKLVQNRAGRYYKMGRNDYDNQKWKYRTSV